MKYRIFIALGFVCLLGCTEYSKEHANEKDKIDSVITYYKNGKINIIRILKDGHKIGGKRFDKDGILLNEDFKTGATSMLDYYQDTLLFKETYYHILDKPREDGAVALEDSVRIYSHNPNELILKYIIKNDMYYLTYYGNYKPIGYDSVLLESDPLIRKIINTRLGKDSSIERYYGDTEE